MTMCAIGDCYETAQYWIGSLGICAKHYLSATQGYTKTTPLSYDDYHAMKPEERYHRAKLIMRTWDNASLLRYAFQLHADSDEIPGSAQKLLILESNYYSQEVTRRFQGVDNAFSGFTPGRDEVKALLVVLAGGFIRGGQPWIDEHDFTSNEKLFRSRAADLRIDYMLAEQLITYNPQANHSEYVIGNRDRVIEVLSRYLR